MWFETLRPIPVGRVEVRWHGQNRWTFATAIGMFESRPFRLPLGIEKHLPPPP